jgi:hypothetical protein
MRIKKEYIILIVIITALAVYLFLRNPDRTHYQLPEIAEIAKTDISKIEISGKDATISLKKKDKRWYIGPEAYLANTDRVESMLEIIGKITVTALVSESKNYSRYNLDNSNKITVKAWKGDRLKRDFDVGKAATSHRHTFVKLVDDDRVYHVQGNFRDRFSQTVDSLRDKTVLSFNQGEIEEIRITKEQQEIVFVRTEAPVDVSAGQEAEAKNLPSPVWRTPEGEEGDETQLGRLLTALSNLTCEKYINDAKKEDYSNPLSIARLKGPQEYTLSVFAKTDDEAKNYPAVSSANDYPFLLPDWQVKGLMKERAEMLKKQPSSTDVTFPPK